MHEQSRFGRETMLQFAGHLNNLHEAGVTLVTRKGRISPDDIGGLITALIDQQGARGEAENLSARTSSGKRQKLLQTGTWFGTSPYGYGRVILDADGKVITRVEHGERFCRAASHGCKLVPSENPKIVKAIRKMFSDTLDGRSLREIAFDMNDAGLRTQNG